MSRKHSELLQIAKKIDSGIAPSKAPQVSIDFGHLSCEDAAALGLLMRIYSAPAAQANLLRLDDVTALDKARCAIALGDFALALQQLPPFDACSADQLIEYLRIFCFDGHWEETIHLGENILRHSVLTPGNEALVHQTLGISNMELGQFDSSLRHLERSEQLYELDDVSLGLLATHLYRSKLHALMDDFGKSQLLFEKARRMLMKSHYGSKWWLGMLRTVPYAFANDPRLAQCALIFAGCLSQAIGDSFHEKLCQAEYLTLIGDQASLRQLPIEEFRSPRLLAFLKSPGSGTQSAQWLRHRAQIDQNQWFLVGTTEFLLLEKSQMLMDLKRGPSLMRLPSDSPRAKILKLLMTHPEGFTKPDLFEKVWDLRWKQETHGNLLNVTLKNIRANLPDSLTHSANTLRLARQGLYAAL